MYPPTHIVDVLHREVAVFVEEKQPDAYRYGNAAQNLLGQLVVGLDHPFHEIEVGDDGNQKLYDELRCAESIKQY